MSTAVLAIEGLDFSRPPAGEGFRLRLAGLEIAAGEIVALAGESGSGKSTLLDILGLILAPGSVQGFRLRRRDGSDIDVAARLSDDGDPLAEIRRDAIGYVLQQGGLLPFLTVRQNLELTRRPDRPPPLPLEELAERLGIGALLDRKPDAISIGQRQRVAIGRAMMGDPELILADEPTSSLDPPTARRTLDLLIEIARERQVAVIMASHSWALIEDLGLPQIRPVLSDTGGRVTADFARAA